MNQLKTDPDIQLLESRRAVFSLIISSYCSFTTL